MLQPNTLMTWDQMVKAYPDKWVFVEKTKGGLSNVEEGIVRFVAADDEMCKVCVSCRKADLNYTRSRTTESFM